MQGRYDGGIILFFPPKLLKEKTYIATATIFGQIVRCNPDSCTSAFQTVIP